MNLTRYRCTIDLKALGMLFCALKHILDPGDTGRQQSPILALPIWFDSGLVLVVIWTPQICGWGSNKNLWIDYGMMDLSEKRLNAWSKLNAHWCPCHLIFVSSDCNWDLSFENGRSEVCGAEAWLWALMGTVLHLTPGHHWYTQITRDRALPAVCCQSQHSFWLRQGAQLEIHIHILSSVY